MVSSSSSVSNAVQQVTGGGRYARGLVSGTFGATELEPSGGGGRGGRSKDGRSKVKTFDVLVCLCVGEEETINQQAVTLYSVCSLPGIMISPRVITG